jgi:hypothetical protein
MAPNVMFKTENFRKWNKLNDFNVFSIRSYQYINFLHIEEMGGYRIRLELEARGVWWGVCEVSKKNKTETCYQIAWIVSIDTHNSIS